MIKKKTKKKVFYSIIFSGFIVSRTSLVDRTGVYLFLLVGRNYHWKTSLVHGLLHCDLSSFSLCSSRLTIQTVMIHTLKPVLVVGGLNNIIQRIDQGTKTMTRSQIRTVSIRRSDKLDKKKKSDRVVGFSRPTSRSVQ